MHAVPRTSTNTVVWAGQWALAYAFLTTGLLKLCLPAEELQGQLGLAAAAPASLLPTLGAIELVAALLVILPSATRVLPQLTPFAATALASLAAIGAVRPESAGGLGLAGADAGLAVLALLVSWARLAVVPLAPLSLDEPVAGAEDPAEVARVQVQVERARARRGGQLAIRFGRGIRPLGPRPQEVGDRVAAAADYRSRAARAAPAERRKVLLHAGR
jgi:hypothetical protein